MSISPAVVAPFLARPLTVLVDPETDAVLVDPETGAVLIEPED